MMDDMGLFEPTGILDRFADFSGLRMNVAKSWPLPEK